mmetsp:Transcript_9869/g.9974  ORF Transcript_9869/g.9974 Transcript_9869/m.9974 type:complete len:154 (-) Transcript_9869:624-1085(-)
MFRFNNHISIKILWTPLASEHQHIKQSFIYICKKMTQELCEVLYRHYTDNCNKIPQNTFTSIVEEQNPTSPKLTISMLKKWDEMPLVPPPSLLTSVGTLLERLVGRIGLTVGGNKTVGELVGRNDGRTVVLGLGGLNKLTPQRNTAFIKRLGR